MSLILDALNRSRRDTDEVPGIATAHYVDGPDEQGRGLRSYLPWLGLLAASAIIAWLLLDRQTAQREPPQSTVSTAAPAAPVAQPGRPELRAGPAPQRDEAGRQPPRQVADTPPESATGLAVGGSSQQAQALPSGPAGQRSVPAASGTVGASSKTPETQEIDAPSADAGSLGVGSGAAVADIYRRQGQAAATPPATAGDPVAAPTTPVTQGSPPVTANKAAQVAGGDSPGRSAAAAREDPIDIEKLVLKAQQEVEDARLAEHSAPFISELSQQAKDSIPTVFYEKHDYSGTPGRSSVILNGKALKAGASAGAGLKVEEILPDSVVLDYRGTRFRLRALNSWINL